MKALSKFTPDLEFSLPGPKISPSHDINGFRRPAPQFTQNTAWLAFQNGMKALHRYANRSIADSAEIAKINLQLLHQTLLTDLSYRERINASRHAAVKSGLSTVDNLLSMNDFSADLITLLPGCRTLIMSYEHYNHMYMIISGKLAINHHNDPSGDIRRFPRYKPWWKRLQNIPMKNVFGKGKVILPREDIQSGELLSALKHRCVLLRITLSAENQPFCL